MAVLCSFVGLMWLVDGGQVKETSGACNTCDPARHAMSSTTIHVPLLEPVESSGLKFLSKFTPAVKSEEESDLLKDVRAALRGSEDNISPPTAPRSASFLPSLDEPEYEVIWTENTVILLTGGIITRRWTFHADAQAVHCACIGWLGRDGENAKTPTVATNTKTIDSNARPTFGPFARSSKHAPKPPKPETPTLAVFVFLRSLCRVYALKTGTEYCIPLPPIVVSHAWPITPHGVLLQRAIEPGELKEKEGEQWEGYPGMCSLTEPFTDAFYPLIVSGLVGGLDGVSTATVTAKPKEKWLTEASSLIWVSHKCSSSKAELAATFDCSTSQVSLYRYAHISSSAIRRRRAKSDTPVSPSTPLSEQNTPAMPKLPPRNIEETMDRIMQKTYGDEVPSFVGEIRLDKPSLAMQSLYTVDLSEAE